MGLVAARQDPAQSSSIILTTITRRSRLLQFPGQCDAARRQSVKRDGDHVTWMRVRGGHE
jgi:hypothetical protein